MKNSILEKLDLDYGSSDEKVEESKIDMNFNKEMDAILPFG